MIHHFVFLLYTDASWTQMMKWETEQPSTSMFWSRGRRPWARPTSWMVLFASLLLSRSEWNSLLSKWEIWFIRLAIQTGLIRIYRFLILVWYVCTDFFSPSTSCIDFFFSFFFPPHCISLYRFCYLKTFLLKDHLQIFFQSIGAGLWFRKFEIFVGLMALFKILGHLTNGA